MRVARDLEHPSGRQESLTTFILAGDVGFRVYLKRYRPRRPSLRFFLRRSRQRRERCSAERLLALGIPTAEVIAAGEQRRFGCVSAAFVATREIPDTCPLDVVVPEWWGERTAQTHRRRHGLIVKLARLVRRMHDGGYVDHDLHLRNILMRELPGELPTLFMIDSPRGGCRFLRGRGKVRDLAALDRDAGLFLTKADRLRFMRAYLGRGRLNRRDKDLVARIIRHVKPRRTETIR
jgi:tRNA A-37 threonylcarbamoyl transferase component Bud32